MARKCPLISRDSYGFTINLGRRVGVNFRTMLGADDRNYLVIIGWYPRTWRLLGYWRASIRVPRRSLA